MVEACMKPYCSGSCLYSSRVDDNDGFGVAVDNNEFGGAKNRYFK